MEARNCSLIIPASGFSRRFGTPDKLFADCAGAPLLSYAAKTAAEIGFAQMIAVVTELSGLRATAFRENGFQIIENPSPELGQHHSIKLGMKHVQTASKAVCVMLADMPLVPVAHIKALLDQAPESEVIRTAYEDHAQPPVIFSGQAMSLLRSGAPPKFDTQSGEGALSIPLASPFGMDVDTPNDLQRAADYMTKNRNGVQASP